MANERLTIFPPKTSPVKIDILYCGDSANLDNEVKVTIGQLSSALTSNDIAQGTLNKYATNDNGDTDNLITLPTIVSIQNQIDSISDDINLLDMQTIYDQSSLKQIKLTIDGLVFLNPNNSQNFFIDDSGNGSRLPFSIIIGTATSTQSGNEDSHIILSTPTEDIAFYSEKYNAWGSDGTLPAFNALLENIGYHCNLAGNESAFYDLQLKSNGTLSSFFKLYGTFSPTSDPKDSMKQGYLNLDQMRIGSNTPENYVSKFEVFSITQGTRPFPRMIDTQVNSLDITTSYQVLPVGLFVYNTTYDILQYLTSLASFSTILSIDGLESGTNISLDKSIPGKVTINSSGGGSTPNSSFGSFVVNNNSVTTSVGTSFSPISAPAFTDVGSSDFNNQIMIISGISTPISVYTGLSTQYFTALVTASCQISTVINNNYYLCISIRKANGTIINTSSINAINLKTINDQLDISCNASVQLETGDGIFFQIRADTVAGLNIKYITSDVTNKVGSLPNVYANTFSPTLFAVAGITGTPTLLSATYFRIGGVATYSIQGTFVANDSLVVLGITPPVASAFTLSNQCSGSGSVFDTVDLNAVDGTVRQITADTVNARLSAEISLFTGSGTKNFTLVGQCQII